MNFKALKKKLVLVLAIVMIVSSFGTSFAAVTFSDLNKAEWAKETILKWSGFGLVSGYNDGTFRPSNKITRAEFAVMAMKAFDLESTRLHVFKDVKSSDWFYQQVSQMARLGYINGYADGTFRPNSPITRAEAAAIIANIMGLTQDVAGAGAFIDMDVIPAWARGYVGAVAKAGFVSGYTDFTFRASNNITRAETVAMLNNTVYGQNHFAKDWRIVTPGTYGGTSEKPIVVEGNVYIKSADVVLRNVEVKGKLIIGVEVGEGDATLNDVVVQGDTNVYGGGVNSVKINGGSYGKVFVMKSASTPVRLLVANVNNVDVVIPQANSKVVLEGIFNSVAVMAQNVQVKTQGNTTIETITFAQVAVNVVLETSEGTVIATAIINVELTVLGQGRIITAEVTVENVTFEKQPEVVNNVPTTPVVVIPPASGGGTITPPPVQNEPNYKFLIVKGGTQQLIGEAYYNPTTALNFSILSQIYEENKGTFEAVTDKYVDFFNEALAYEVSDRGYTFAYALATRINNYNGQAGPLMVFSHMDESIIDAILNGEADYETLKDFAQVMAGSMLDSIFSDLEKLYANDEENLSAFGLTMTLKKLDMTYNSDPMVKDVRFFLNHMYTDVMGLTIADAANTTEIFSLSNGSSTIKFVVRAIN